MKRDTRTNAQKLRDHRAAFELALKLKITPAKAKELINQRTMRERHAASTASLAAKMNPPLARALTDPEPARGPWWQDRD